MNGRCTADPLDHADDVCEFCGDEFCSSCLLRTRNGKGPLVCRQCAVANSGVKGSRPTKPRVTKAQAQRARARLLEGADDRQEGGFRYFDDEEGWVEPGVIAEVEAPVDHASKPPSRRFKRRGKSEPNMEITDPIDDEPVRIQDALDQVREASPPPEESPAATLYIPDSVAAEIDRDVHADVPPPPVLPPQTGTTPEHTPPLSATPLADRLRSEAAPASASLDVDPFSLDHDPFANSDPEPQPAMTNVAEPIDQPWSFPATVPSPDPSPSGFDWHAYDAKETEPGYVTPDDDPFAPPAPTVSPAAPAQTDPAPWTPGPTHQAPPQRASAAPAPAPAPPNAAPAPSPQPVTTTEPTVLASLMPQSAGTATVEAADHPSADLDSNGNWVPPVLRGMAPVEERRAESLPRRRNSD